MFVSAVKLFFFLQTCANTIHKNNGQFKVLKLLTVNSKYKIGFLFLSADFCEKQKSNYSRISPQLPVFQTILDQASN